MNIIAAVILYHAEEYVAFWIMTIVFEKLEIRDVFLPCMNKLYKELPGIRKHSVIIEKLL
jgi:hypothetical protein